MSGISRHGPRGIPNGLTIESYTVGSWCPTPDGSGKPTAVALSLEIPQLTCSLVMRLKTRRAVNDMITALKEHRDNVFGPQDN